MAGRDAVGGTVVAGEPARVAEAPPVSGGRDRVACGVGVDELTGGVFETDTAQVDGGSAAEVTAEGQLQGADGDEGGTGDVGDADVAVGVVVDEADRAAKRRGVSVVTVF